MSCLDSGFRVASALPGYKPDMVDSSPILAQPGPNLVEADRPSSKSTSTLAELVGYLHELVHIWDSRLFEFNPRLGCAQGEFGDSGAVLRGETDFRRLPLELWIWPLRLEMPVVARGRSLAQKLLGGSMVPLHLEILSSSASDAACLNHVQ